jgi:VWFA-related protein
MRLNRAVVAVVGAAVGFVGMAASVVRAQQNSVQTKQSQATGKPEYTLQARVPLTILDVTVTDSKGHPVHGLQQSDFTVLEDKEEMKPNSFEEHRSDETPPSTSTLVQQDLPPNTFTNVTPTPPKAGPINILLLDSLNTPAQDQGMVERQMIDFVNKMPTGTRVAVLGLTTHLFILQGLTSDPELLKAAINSKKILPMPSAVEDPFRDLMDPSSGVAEDAPMLVDREGEQAAIRGQYELTGMRQIARYLAGMPGRKNLIWFAGSFPLQFPPFPDSASFPPPKGLTIRPQTYDYEAEMKTATDLLFRAHVAVYPIDSHGLEAIIGTREAPKFMTKNLDYMNMTEHMTMDTIAEQTGGKAFYNTNGLTEAAEQAIENGSNFYTLTYTPTNQKPDTRFRTIKVQVDQPGLKLVYRDGYYAVDPGSSLNGARIVKLTTMQSAMMRGGLTPTQIPFKVKIAQAPGTEDALPAGNKPDAKQMKLPYRHYSISYVIDVNNISFSPSLDGNFRGDFEFATMVYNADGDEVVNTVTKEVSPILPPAVYQSMLKGGANAHQEIAVPATGEYFLRIAVHDLTSDRVGAIEIPTSSITPNNLPAVVSGK